MMRWEPPSSEQIQRSLFQDLNRDELKIVEAIKMGVDDVEGLGVFMSMLQSEMASYLLELEMKGVVRSIPGNRYLILE